MNVDRVSVLTKELERANGYNKWLTEEINRQKLLIDELRKDLLVKNDYITRNKDDNNIWFFQNDGYDHIDTLVDSLQVLISASDLKYILKNGEKYHDD